MVAVAHQSCPVSGTPIPHLEDLSSMCNSGSLCTWEGSSSKLLMLATVLDRRRLS